ncbi:hypothetical protein [Streptomyces sp. H27-H5]|uniref:hypothetical protein n=1 Tax=Streptomyces sp. H27-H5 TaxID=2996460 RepID=UPI00226E1E80|nr:hypothetical protein [Streptomyces sp. H27-H5]
MPIQVPDLDVLRFQDLVDAAKRALPPLCPGWTDHNVSDPGITLIEAAAEQVDRLSYRVDRVPPSHLHGLLRLLGVTVIPTVPDRVMISARATASAETKDIPVGTEFPTEDKSVFLFVTTPTRLAGEGKETIIEAVLVEHLMDHEVGTSMAVPGNSEKPRRGQRFVIRGDPLSPALWGDIVQNHLTVVVRVGERRQPWDSVRSFAGYSDQDKVHTWDPITREVVFGPEVETDADNTLGLGAAPDLGSSILVNYYTATEKRPPIISVSEEYQDFEFSVLGQVSGGCPREEIAAALRRFTFGLNPIQRATSLRDYEHELMRRFPTLKRVNVRLSPGSARTTSITVQAVPNTEGLDQPAPLSGNVLDRLQEEVDSLRLIGAKATISNAQYKLFGIQLRVKLMQGDSRQEEAREAISKGLARYFHPLHGGESAEGWAWGRTINTGDVYHVLNGIKEIYTVSQVQFTDSSLFVPSSSSEVELSEEQLPWLESSLVEVVDFNT